MELNFTKLHGLGNDFVFIDDFNESIELTAEQVAFLCDRHFGIGGDGAVPLVRRGADAGEARARQTQIWADRSRVKARFFVFSHKIYVHI